MDFLHTEPFQSLFTASVLVAMVGGLVTLVKAYLDKRLKTPKEKDDCVQRNSDLLWDQVQKLQARVDELSDRLRIRDEEVLTWREKFTELEIRYKVLDRFNVELQIRLATMESQIKGNGK
jgi:predicted nuclease with TOPRIM domain